MSTAGHNLSAFNKEDMPDASSFGFGLVVAEWNDEITEALYQGAKETLIALGVSPQNIVTIKVPGSLELTYGARKLAEWSHVPSAIISIGAVIRGETAHFDYVCQSVFQGLTDLNLQLDLPVIGCVLTDDTIEQSRARAGGKHGNKGVEAAVTAVKMAALRSQLNESN